MNTQKLDSNKKIDRIDSGNRLLDDQRKLIALAIPGPNDNPVNPSINQLSNGAFDGSHEKVRHFASFAWFKLLTTLETI